MIKKESDGYHIYSHDGKKHLGGPYSKAYAETRLKQIEYYKNVKESNISKAINYLDKHLNI